MSTATRTLFIFCFFNQYFIQANISNYIQCINISKKNRRWLLVKIYIMMHYGPFSLQVSKFNQNKYLKETDMKRRLLQIILREVPRTSNYLKMSGLPFVKLVRYKERACEKGNFRNNAFNSLFTVKL